MIRKLILKKYIILFFLILIVFSYQNCSRVELIQNGSVEVPFFAATSGLICLDGNLQNFTLESLYVQNLNLVSDKKTVAIDSDSDFIADEFESSFGFSSSVRRSNSKVMDSVCLNLSGNSECESQLSSCDPANENKIGLNQCEIKSFGLDLLYNHPNLGLDSDKDGIPDLLEISKSTMPNEDDSTLDSDHDLLITSQEISRGRNPNYYDDTLADKHQIKFSIKKLASSHDCGGEQWSFILSQVPIVHLSAFQDVEDARRINQELKFSHGKDENNIVIYIKLRPKAGSQGNAQLYFKQYLIKIIENTEIQSFDFKFEDFVKSGEIEI